jgi:hypothetical protein
MLQTFREKVSSIYHNPASTLLGGVPMLQTCSEKLTLVYHNSGIKPFVAGAILQTYSKKLSFVYHNSGINTFVGASTLLGDANVAKCKHTFVCHNSGIYIFVGLPMLQSYSEKLTLIYHHSSINSQHYWGAFKGENSLLYTTTPVLTQ